MKMIFFDSISTICLPIIASILGIAMPIIIQTVAQIDNRYNSIRLVHKFKSEKHFHYFLISLIFSIAALIYNHIVRLPWKYDWGVLNKIMYESSNILLLGSTIVLIYFLFKITMLIILYHDYQKLYWHVRNKIDVGKEVGEKNIRDIAELGKFILLKDDNKTSANFYQLLHDYSDNKYRTKVFEAVELDDWFYDIIFSLNETLCRAKIFPISIAHGNDLLKILIPENPEIVISDKTYRILWRTLQQQLYYDKEDLVYEYWIYAHQYIWLYLKPIGSGILIEDLSLKEINDKEKDKRNEQIRRFKEFHIALCGFILYSKKYDLLKKVISFTSTVPYQFPLVPSTFSEIMEWFHNFNKKSEENYFYYQSNFSFESEKGIEAGNIVLSWCNRYLSLLFLRLNSFEVLNMYSWLNPWVMPEISHMSLKETTEYLSNFEQLKLYIEDWRKNNITNLIDLFGWNNNGDIDQIENIIDDCINNCNEEIRKKRDNLLPSPDKIKQFKDKSLEIISDTVDSYKSLLNKCTCPGENHIKDVINPSFSRPIDKEAFSKDQTIQFANYDEVVADTVVREFYHLYSLSFYKNSKRFISIDSDKFLQAIEKLIGEKVNQYVVICFGLNLDYYSNKPINQLTKVIEGDRNYSKYIYKQKIEIHSLPSGNNAIMDSNVVIINKDDLPCYQKQEPPQETIDKYNLEPDGTKNIIYSSILCENFPKELSNIDKSKFCIATIYYCILLYWKKDAEVINLKLITKYTDTGVGEDILKLKEL